MDPLKMYFLLKMEMFQPAMLVYQRVMECHVRGSTLLLRSYPARFQVSFCLWSLWISWHGKRKEWRVWRPANYSIVSWKKIPEFVPRWCNSWPNFIPIVGGHDSPFKGSRFQDHKKGTIRIARLMLFCSMTCWWCSNPTQVDWWLVHLESSTS